MPDPADVPVPATFSGRPWPPWWRPLQRRAWRRAEEHALRHQLAVLQAALARMVLLVPAQSRTILDHAARLAALIELSRENPRRYQRLLRLIPEKRAMLARVGAQATTAPTAEPARAASGS